MNIIENKKRIAIIGKGTAGSITASHFNHYSKNEIVWYYNSNIPSQSVGEGSTLPFSNSLYYNLGLKHRDLKKINGVPKIGIHKINWGGTGNFIHDFPIGNFAMHFDAVEFQKLVFQKLSSQLKIIDTNIKSSDNIDADYIIDCSGTKEIKNDFIEANSMAVNAAFITQCYWDFPRFNNTLTIARPYGWVFGIPLENRCSIGYIYNKDINNLEEIKEDVKNIFDEYNLVPSNNTNSLNFKNYYRKINYTKRISYNGNSSFFLEPIEATSTGLINRINRKIFDLVFNKHSISEANNEYQKELIDLQRMILLHYLSKSKFSTPFWDQAYQKAENFISKNLHQKDFLKMYNLSKKCLKNNQLHLEPPIHDIAQWNLTSYNINLKELDLYNKIDNLLKVK
jgi:hypothetical protein